MENLSVFDAVNSNGQKYFEFRKTLQPNYKIVWRDIALAYMAIAFFMFLSWYLEEKILTGFWIVIPLISLIIGYIIAFLQLYCHEAIHFNLHPDKKQNDLLANLFLFSLAGNDIETCRKRHWKHHYFLGTTKDPENAYFKPLSTSLILGFLSGFHFVKNVFIRKMIQIRKLELHKRDSFQLILFCVGVILNLSIVLICMLASHWQTGIIWLLSMTIFFPLFSTVRQILEHRDQWADAKIDYTQVDHGKVTRIFENGFLGRTFGGAGFNRQMLHHLDPEISYTRFDDMEAFLKDCPKFWVDIYRSKTTYFETYLWLIR